MSGQSLLCALGDAEAAPAERPTLLRLSIRYVRFAVRNGRKTLDFWRLCD
jgi:hypothetical protein